MNSRSQAATRRSPLDVQLLAVLLWSRRLEVVIGYPVTSTYRGRELMVFDEASTNPRCLASQSPLTLLNRGNTGIDFLAGEKESHHVTRHARTRFLRSVFLWPLRRDIFYIAASAPCACLGAGGTRHIPCLRCRMYT